MLLEAAGRVSAMLKTDTLSAYLLPVNSACVSAKVVSK